MVKKDKLMKLRMKLPRGFGHMLAKRFQRKGEPYTAGYIRRVLNPNDKCSNDEILKEAIKLVRDTKEKRKSIEKQITQAVEP